MNTFKINFKHNEQMNIQAGTYIVANDPRIN